MCSATHHPSMPDRVTTGLVPAPACRRASSWSTSTNLARTRARTRGTYGAEHLKPTTVGVERRWSRWRPDLRPSPAAPPGSSGRAYALALRSPGVSSPWPTSTAPRPLQAESTPAGGLYSQGGGDGGPGHTACHATSGTTPTPGRDASTALVGPVCPDLRDRAGSAPAALGLPCSAPAITRGATRADCQLQYAEATF